MMIQELERAPSTDGGALKAILATTACCQYYFYYFLFRGTIIFESYNPAIYDIYIYIYICIYNWC